MGNYAWGTGLDYTLLAKPRSFGTFSGVSSTSVSYALIRLLVYSAEKRITSYVSTYVHELLTSDLEINVGSRRGFVTVRT